MSDFVTPWTAACQASLSITNSQSPPKPMSIEWVMPSNHLILCHPILLLPSIFPSIRVFSNESALCIRWPKYWSFSFNIRPSNEHPGLIEWSTTTYNFTTIGITLSIYQYWQFLTIFMKGCKGIQWNKYFKVSDLTLHLFVFRVILYTFDYVYTYDLLAKIM